MKEDLRHCRLYLLTPPQIDLDSFPALLADVLDAGDVACLQIRLRDEAGQPVSDDVMRAAATALIPVCHERDVAVLLEASPEMVLETGADGIQAMFDGYKVADLRHQLGDERLIGIGCANSRHNAMEAAEEGADYVSFGPFYDSRSVPDREAADRDHLAWWQMMMEVPVVAIGGIKQDTAREMAEAGADFVAVIGGVWDAEDGPVAAVKAFSDALADPV